MGIIKKKITTIIGRLGGFKEIIHIKMHIQHQKLWSEIKHGRPLHATHCKQVALDSAQMKKKKPLLKEKKLHIPGHGTE